MDKNINTTQTEDKARERNVERLAQVASGQQVTPLFQVKPLPSSLMSRLEQCCIR